jgi:uncharacterized repeat protein (TIGR01451 family)
MAADWPRCQSGCDAKDASITNIWLVVAEPDCTPGTPTSAELWATFKVTRKKGICCVVSVVDIYVGPDLIEDDYTTNIGQDLPEGTYNRKIADITWTCGSKLTLKDIYAQWIPGGGQPCPSCRWNCDDYSIPAKCYYDAGPYEVPAPLIANFTFDNVCFCTYTQFTNETTGGVPPYTFDWNFGDGTPHDITENPSHHYGAADTYSVTLAVTDSNTTENTDSQSYDVTVYSKPTASASSNSPVCVGDTLTLTGGPDGMATYSWTGPNDSTVSTSATLAMAGDYTLTVTDAHGCTDFASITVIVSKPTASASSNSPVCVGDTIELYGGPDNMASYSWAGPGGWTNNGQDPTRPDATLAMAGAYTLTVTDAHGCTDSDDVTVTVVASCEATAPDFSICQGTTVNDQLFTDNGASCSGDCTVSLGYNFDGNTAGVYTYTVTCVGDCGGDTEGTVTVRDCTWIDVDKTAHYGGLCPFETRPAKIGETVTYRFTVTNTGEVTLTGITVSDDLYGPVTIRTKTLAPGKSTVGKITHVLEEYDFPSVTDTATATGTDPFGRTVTDTDECTVHVEIAP